VHQRDSRTMSRNVPPAAPHWGRTRLLWHPNLHHALRHCAVGVRTRQLGSRILDHSSTHGQICNCLETLCICWCFWRNEHHSPQMQTQLYSFTGRRQRQVKHQLHIFLPECPRALADSRSDPARQGRKIECFLLRFQSACVGLLPRPLVQGLESKVRIQVSKGSIAACFIQNRSGILKCTSVLPV
jgi:hypothetical protein